MSLVKIQKDTDPFKKYWWAILLLFAGTGAWVCMPLMDSSIGSVSVSKRGLATQNQSLDAMTNPSGAPGSAVDLSMDGAYSKKKAEGEQMSSLYQAPPEEPTGAAAPGAPLTAGTGSASFADALKDVSKQNGASGWGGAKAQAGFTPPKANFGGLTGLGGSGAGSGASYGGGASTNLFGQSAAKTAMATTRGLGAADSGAGVGAKAIMNSLKGAASQGQSALSQKSLDASRALAGASFDGSRGGNPIESGKGTSAGGSYAGLDAAPANLKVNDPNANAYKIESVPGKFAAAANTSDQMKQAIIMMVVAAVVGGVVTGMVNSIFGAGAGGATSPAIGAATSGMSQNYGMKK